MHARAGGVEVRGWADGWLAGTGVGGEAWTVRRLLLAVHRKLWELELASSSSHSFCEQDGARAGDFERAADALKQDLVLLCRSCGKDRSSRHS